MLDTQRHVERSSFAASQADAQETAAGALYALAATAENRVSIASAGGITPLIALFDGGSEEAKEQAAGALMNLASNNVANQTAIMGAGALAPLLALLKHGYAELHISC